MEIKIDVINVCPVLSDIGRRNLYQALKRRVIRQHEGARNAGMSTGPSRLADRIREVRGAYYRGVIDPARENSISIGCEMHEMIFMQEW